jgi:hypothetical protein
MKSRIPDLAVYVVALVATVVLGMMTGGLH